MMPPANSLQALLLVGLWIWTKYSLIVYSVGVWGCVHIRGQLLRAGSLLPSQVLEVRLRLVGASVFPCWATSTSLLFV